MSDNILIGSACALALGLAILIMAYGRHEAPGWQTKSLTAKIEDECRRSYGDRGQLAVDECNLAMTARYLQDSDRDLANKTYGRIR